MAAFSKLAIIGVKMTKSDHKVFASLKMSSCLSLCVSNEY